MAVAEAAAMTPAEEILERLEDPRIEAHLLSKLKSAHGTARAALATELARIGLTTPQFLALAAIEHNADISSAELARQSFVTPQAMIAIVARLESAKLITRVPAARGGRSLTMRLTPNGQKALSEARRHAMAIERYILELLGAERFGVLLDALDAATAALSQGATMTKTMPWDRFVPGAATEPNTAASETRRASTRTKRRTSPRPSPRKG